MSISSDLTNAVSVEVIPSTQGNMVVKKFDKLDKGDHIHATHACGTEIGGPYAYNSMMFIYYSDGNAALFCSTCGYRVGLRFPKERLPWTWLDFLHAVKHGTGVDVRQVINMIERSL